MLGRSKIKFLAAAILVTFLGGVLAGCGTTGKTKEQVIRYNIGAEPKTIDPTLNNSVEGGTVGVNAFEGLTSVDANEKVIPGVAEKWEISDNQLTYTFHLRKDAKWSDGKAVKAADFVYSWKRALAPETASEYAYQVYYLKNGEAYNNSQNKDWTGKKATADEVGVKAVDENTLEVTLENPTAYFLSLMSFPTYMPEREDIVSKNKEKWATKPDTYVTNGPFKMSEWKIKDSLTFVKNDNYWNAKSIKVSKVVYKFIDQETSSLAGFKTGQLDIIDLIPSAEKPGMLKDGTAIATPYLGTYFYSLNIANDPTAAAVLKDVKVRKALSLAINREELVKDVTKGGEVAATTFVPKGMPDGTGKEFKTTDYYKGAGDAEAAKKLLAEAGYADGKNFPKIEIIYNAGQNHQNIGVKVQADLKKNLGIDVTLRSVDRKVQLDALAKHKYQVSRTGWIADYSDPMTFLDMFVTSGGNNNPGYSNSAYDKLINDSKAEKDLAKRATIMHEAEDVLMADMPIIPLYYYSNVIAVKPNIKNVHKSPLGFTYFNLASVE